MDKKLLSLGVFLAGILVGANWPKIKKTIDPQMKKLEKKSNQVYNKAAEFAAQQKERVEDALAALKARKKITPKTTS